MPFLRRCGLSTALDQGVPSKAAPSDTTTVHATNSRRHNKNKERNHHIYTDGSCKKSSHEYDDIFLAVNGPTYSGRIRAGAGIIITPPSEDWRKDRYMTLMCIEIKDRSAIGTQSLYPMKLMAIVAALQLGANTDCH